MKMKITPEIQLFVKQHENQLLQGGVPKHFWPTLHEKLSKQVFDSGNTFSLLQIDYDGEDREEYHPIFHLQVKLEDGVDCNNPEHIYLIDHAWTFQIEFARKQLLANTDLLGRMCGIMGIKNESPEMSATEVMKRVWEFANTYSLKNAREIEERLPIWYVMDEVGCAIIHSDNPNFKMVPFIHVPEQLAYSLIFPLINVDFDEVITRNCIDGIKGDAVKAHLLPWVQASVQCSFENVVVNDDYYLSGRIQESLPVLENEHQFNKKPLKFLVYSQYEYVNKYLIDTRFEFVDNQDIADILWLTTPFKSFKEFSFLPSKFINQFPFEYVITTKDLLAVICRKKCKSPKWLPETYNLDNEIMQFVSYYQNREANNLDNHWIVKPFNLARALDTHVTNNLNCIIRLATTNFKIAQKYVDRPVLFYRDDCGKVKFDVRYVFILKKVQPLEAYVYTNFFLRFANKPFELNNLEDYEQHFTVMNYRNQNTLKHMRCEEFKHNWENQFPSNSWKKVEDSIFIVLKEMLECATSCKPPQGIAESFQSRAVYAADLILEWDHKEIQPKLLEVNWTPDCQRACEYYPEFFNDIFRLCFYDEVNSDVFYKL